MALRAGSKAKARRHSPPAALNRISFMFAWREPFSVSTRGRGNALGQMAGRDRLALRDGPFPPAVLAGHGTGVAHGIPPFVVWRGEREREARSPGGGRAAMLTCSPQGAGCRQGLASSPWSTQIVGNGGSASG